MLHPVDDLAVELFLNGNVRHRCGRRGSVPVLLAWREPDHVAGTDFFDGPPLALPPAAPCRDDECLAEGMRVPSGPRTGLEGHAGALDQRGIRGLKERVLLPRPRE